MKTIRYLKRLTDLLFFRSLRAMTRSGKQSEKTIVLVRTDGIGDFVFFVRYLKSIATGFPDHKIILVCSLETASLARRIRIIDSVIECRIGLYAWNYLYRLFILKSIRSYGPRVSVYCSYHRRHIGDEMTILSGAARSMAMSGNNECIDDSTRIRNNTLYTDLVETEDHVPEDQRYRRLLHALDCRHEPSSFRELYNHGVPDEVVRVPGRYAVVAPGGSAMIRRWNPERFAAVADGIASLGFKIILSGNQREGPTLRRIRGMMKEPATIIDRVSLPQAVDLLRQASVFVGNESGLLHLAASVGTPAVGILGGGHFRRYFPYTDNCTIVHHPLDCYDCNWRCPFPEPFCITRIAVSDVVKGIEQAVLAGQRTGKR